MQKSSNYESISQIIVDVTIEFDIKREKLLVMISDAASYMKKSMVVLDHLFPNIRHLTCIEYLFHNCAMKIKSFYRDVDHLISSIKSLTFKNNTRKQMFISVLTLPDAVVTRWGTWLEAAFYYAKHFVEIKHIVNKITGPGILLENAKESVNSKTVHSSLTKIFECYKSVLNNIDLITSSDLSIAKASKAIQELEFGCDPVNISDYIKKRLKKERVLFIFSRGILKKFLPN
ncbi:hypothetical protein CDIK_3692 [Cucumispora dikerogammari]|nr:hypothetical protein CDIK_3692 [Cucumispora dikerogammari]